MQRWYFFARHGIDDHNNLRSGNLSLEDYFGTHRWELQQLWFFIALSEVFCLLLWNYFVVTEQGTKKGAKPLSKAAARRLLAKQLIKNPG